MSSTTAEVTRAHRSAAVMAMFPNSQGSPLWNWVETGEGDHAAIQRVAQAIANAGADVEQPTDCPMHGEHGKEAELLRAGIEKVLSENFVERFVRVELQTLLDKTDAADSLAYLERNKARTPDEWQEDGSCTEDDATCDCLWHENKTAAEATRPPEPVTIRAKLLELDASNADGLVRLAFDMPMEEARRLAPFLFEHATLTIAKPSDAASDALMKG